jgi:hypothetical protein
MDTLERVVDCNTCGKVEPKAIKQGNQLRGDCPKCGQFIKWLKQKDAGFLPVIEKFASRMSADQKRLAIRILESA